MPVFGLTTADLRIDHRLDHRREGLLAVVGQAVEQEAVERIRAFALLQQRSQLPAGDLARRGADGAAGAREVLDHSPTGPSARSGATCDQAVSLSARAPAATGTTMWTGFRGEAGRFVGGSLGAETARAESRTGAAAACGRQAGAGGRGGQGGWVGPVRGCADRRRRRARPTKQPEGGGRKQSSSAAARAPRRIPRRSLPRPRAVFSLPRLPLGVPS